MWHVASRQSIAILFVFLCKYAFVLIVNRCVPMKRQLGRLQRPCEVNSTGSTCWPSPPYLCFDAVLDAYIHDPQQMPRGIV